jgi:hypothetical protein
MKGFKNSLIKAVIPILALLVLAGILSLKKYVRPDTDVKTIIINDNVLKKDVEKDNALKIAKGETVTFNEGLDNIIGYLDNKNLLVAMNHMLYYGSITNSNFRVYDENFSFKQIIEVSKNSRKIIYLSSENVISVYDVKTKTQTKLVKSANELDDKNNVMFLSAHSPLISSRRYLKRS